MVPEAQWMQITCHNRGFYWHFRCTFIGSLVVLNLGLSPFLCMRRSAQLQGRVALNLVHQGGAPVSDSFW